ncbi:MAG: cysteine hydrolase [Candidatus Bipolaricaulota bacterium]|nr:cysteine hydrolase [Candidatus Bipolaricaulota bacterium]
MHETLKPLQELKEEMGVATAAEEARFGGGNPLGDIVTAITPREGDPVVWKTTGDAFYQTNLNSILAAMGVHRVLIAGLATHGCITDTLLGALSGRYETWAVADAHGDAGGPGLETQYNAAWVTWGIRVVASQDIDFAAFQCGTSAAPAGG